MPSRSPRLITYMRKLPSSISVGFPLTSACSFALFTTLPSTLASTPDSNSTVTSSPWRINRPALAGPEGNTMGLSFPLPKTLSPAFSQNNPASGSQFCLRSSTNSAFHLSKSLAYAASGGWIAKATSARKHMVTRHATTCSRRPTESRPRVFRPLSFTCILPRIGQWFHPPASKDFLKLAQQRFVKKSVAGERLPAIQLKLPAGKSCHPSASFLRDQNSRGRVPRIQIEFPES